MYVQFFACRFLRSGSGSASVNRMCIEVDATSGSALQRMQIQITSFKVESGYGPKRGRIRTLLHTLQRLHNLILTEKKLSWFQKKGIFAQKSVIYTLKSMHFQPVYHHNHLVS